MIVNYLQCVASLSASTCQFREGMSIRVAAGSFNRPRATRGQPARQPQIVRKLIWFHHIKNLEKRKSIVSWANQLQVRAGNVGRQGGWVESGGWGFCGCWVEGLPSSCLMGLEVDPRQARAAKKRLSQQLACCLWGACDRWALGLYSLDVRQLTHFRSSGRGVRRCEQ